MIYKEKLKQNQKDSALLIIIAYFAMTLLSTVILSFVKEKTNVYAYISFALPQLTYISAFFIYYKLRNIPYEFNFKSNAKANGFLYPIAVVCGVGLFFFALPINNIISGFIEKFISLPKITMPVMYNWYDYVLACVIIGIMPAIGEELIYRKALVDGTSNLGTVIAVFISAFVFSLSHMNLTQLLHPLFLGTILALIYMLTKDIVIVFLIHSVNNILAVLLTYLTPNALWAMPKVMLICALIGFIIWICGLGVILYKKFKLEKKFEKFNIYLIIMLIIMVILWTVVNIVTYK